MEKDPETKLSLVKSLDEESGGDCSTGDAPAAPQPASPTAGMSDRARRLFWTQALMKLTESKRFLEFVDANYDIGVHTDEETKTVDIMVVEKPVIVGPRLSEKQIFAFFQAANAHNANNPSALVERICKILGQEPPSIVLASERDVQSAIDQSALKKKLDDE